MKTVRADRTWLIFGLCSLAFIAVNTMTIKDGHNWGDDFAQYIRHAENIAAGKSYAGGIMLEKWAVVPPGFPLLLAPLTKLFGLNLPAMKWLNVIFWQMYAVFAFMLARDRAGGRFGLGISLVLLTAPWFFTFKQNVLSDIPFLFFITAAIWSAERYFSGGGRKYFIIALSAGGYALLTRWAGISFFIVWVLYVLLKREEQKTIFAVLGTVFLLVGILYALGITAASHFQELAVSPAQYAALIGNYIPAVFYAVFSFFVPPATVFSHPIHQASAAVPGYFSLIVLAAGLYGFIRRAASGRITFLGLFSAVYLLGIFFWPIKGGEERYILPLILPAAIFIFESIRNVKISGVNPDFLPGLIGALLIFHNCLVPALYFDFDDDRIYKPMNRELAAWVRENVGEDEHYMFSKPRALGLLTDRLGASYGLSAFDQAHWQDRIGPLRISYLIMSKENQAAEVAQVESGLVPSQLVWQNPVYKVFKVNRPGER